MEPEPSESSGPRSDPSSDVSTSVAERRASLALAIAWLDAGAVALFAYEGATLAAAAGLDLFGVLVIATVSALGGGTIRDLLIGDVPPLSVRTSRYVLLAVAGGLLAFVLFRWLDDIPEDLLIALDAGGLALFAVSGSAKAVEYRLPAFICVCIGGLTAVGGGVMRDVLLSQIPSVLVAEIYATAAIAGSVVVVAGLRLGLRRAPVMVTGALTCLVLRLVAAWSDWNLPTAL